ncbi:MAG: T9SS type A sorting domain-containing protein [Candidatus Zixiibacteriota bacterium]|nr:MAG: T9SS type A sorting domain-containing protein [candidate division Zixibacteria bacterium]
MKNQNFGKFILLFSLFVFCLILFSSRSARSEWKGDIRVNVVSDGKQASRGADCPWSISVDGNNRVHVVWEDRRQGRPLRIYYRGKDPDPTWMKWDFSDYELSIIDSVVIFGHPSIYPRRDGKLFSVYVEERPFGGELYGSWFANHPSRQIKTDMVSSPGGHYLTFSSSGWQTTIAAYEDMFITFWPYVNPELPGSLPVYYKIYDKDEPLTSEQPIIFPERGLEYRGVNLSASAGSNDRIYLVCRIICDEFPRGHIFLLTLNIKNGLVTEIEDLTPNETRYCRFPYIAVSPRKSGNDLIFITFEVSNINSKALFLSNISGVWTEPMILSAGDKTSGYPCVAVNGDFVDFVYEAPKDAPDGQIYHQRFNTITGALSDAVQVTNSTGFFNMMPVIAADSFHNLHLIYITNRENPDLLGDEEVYYSIYDSPPPAPNGFEFNRENNVISWRDNSEPDISHYIVDFNGRDTILYDNHFEIGSSCFDDFIISVQAVDLSGQESAPALYRSTLIGIREIAGVPRSLIVGKNYPNPFNASTSIPISARNMTFPLYLEIFDIKGKIVKTFMISDAARREIIWNGRSDHAKYVSSGVYFYRLRSNTESGKTKAMTFIK